MSAPTALPWRVDEMDFGIVVAGDESTLQFVARCGDEFELSDTAEADAAFIARACNAHTHLLAALVFIRDELAQYLDTMPNDDASRAVHNRAADAIAKVGP